MKKQGRNDPCNCNSGRKYKKCCGKVAQYLETERKTKKMETPNNKFREEAAKLKAAEASAEAEEKMSAIERETEKVGVPAMILRDQYATMRSMQFNRDILEYDREYSEKMAKLYDLFIGEIADLPLSEARDDTLERTAKQLERIALDCAKSQLNAATLAMLDALERLFMEETTEEDEVPVNNISCRVCGCTNLDCSQCIESTGTACHWIESDLCSRCDDEIKMFVSTVGGSREAAEADIIKAKAIKESDNLGKIDEELSSEGQVPGAEAAEATTAEPVEQDDTYDEEQDATNDEEPPEVADAEAEAAETTE